VIQATIWSDRQHCEAAVVAGLRTVDAERLWFVHDPEQLIRLMNLSEGMGVEWRRLEGQTFPQLIHDPHGREAKQIACATSFKAVLDALGSHSGADVLLVDDDIVLPAEAVAEFLGAAKAVPADVVSGLTRCNNGALPVYRFSDQHRMTDAEIPAAPVLIDGCGTFCMYLSAPVVAELHRYWPAVTTKIGPAVLRGHDLSFCHWLKAQGFKLALAPAVRCEHHVQTESGVVVHRL
jgi:hypothetical protein